MAGVSLGDITDHLMEGGARDARRAVEAALQEYAEAVHDYRAATVRALVDEEGFTLSEVARRIAISRQMATRLYHDATLIVPADTEHADFT